MNIEDQVRIKVISRVSDQVLDQVWDQVLLKTQFNVWDHVIKKMRDDYK